MDALKNRKAFYYVIILPRSKDKLLLSKYIDFYYKKEHTIFITKNNS